MLIVSIPYPFSHDRLLFGHSIITSVSSLLTGIVVNGKTVFDKSIQTNFKVHMVGPIMKSIHKIFTI